MTIRKKFALFWLSLNLLWWITPLQADTPLGQTLQINARFHSITGRPTWLLEIRDVDTGVVTPYMFDLQHNNDFWVAFTYGHNYRVAASTLKFGPFAVIHNLCHLENEIMAGKSMIISLSGDLSPSTRTFKCHVIRYNDNAFPIVTDSNNQGTI